MEPITNSTIGNACSDITISDLVNRAASNVSHSNGTMTSPVRSGDVGFVQHNPNFLGGNNIIAPIVHPGQISAGSIAYPNLPPKIGSLNVADLISFYGRVDEIVTFAKRYMSSVYKTDGEIMGDIIWHCGCGDDIHQLSERYCTKCGAFPIGTTKVDFVPNNTNSEISN